MSQQYSQHSIKSSQNNYLVSQNKIKIKSTEELNFKKKTIQKKQSKKQDHSSKKKKKEQIKQVATQNSKFQLQSSPINIPKPQQTPKPQTKLHQSLLQLTDNYKLLGKIGQGGFGFIYKALKNSSQEYVAIKFERKHNQSTSINRLEIEANVMQLLSNNKCFGFPQFKEFQQMKEFSFLVMQQLGLNLEQLLKLMKTQQFSLKTVCMIGIEMLDRLKEIHNLHYLYRDVKPENIVIGDQAEFQCIYLIDFGLAKIYKTQTGKHIEENQRKGLVGTPRYASINSHQGKELSRRDDLESLAYMLVYLFRGTLPWANVPIADKQKKREQIKLLKMKTSISDICQEMPIQFQKFLAYSRKLKFKERPSYEYLQKLLKKVLKTNNEKYDYNFDWNTLFKQTIELKDLLNKEKKITTDSPLTPTKYLQSTLSIKTNSIKNNSINDDQQSPKKMTQRVLSFKQVENDLANPNLLKVDNSQEQGYSSKLAQCSCSE